MPPAAAATADRRTGETSPAGCCNPGSAPNENGAFAGNRFRDTEQVLAFVETLYARGATEVLIDNPGVDSAGAPYADTLLVKCSTADDAWCEVERFCEEEGPGDVPPGDFTMDVYGGSIRLWWD